MYTAVAIVSVLGALWWAWSLYAIVRTVRAIPTLRDDRSPAPPRWPRVSIIVAARNEEEDLERGIRTRLADDYPDLQIVLVEDRSTDGTPAIADRLAASDPRITVVHLTELPEGWLGKLHAMHRGVEAADGEWLLFSDADVEFAPGALRRAIALCEHDARDHMAVLPEFREHGLAIDATLDVFCHVLVAGGRLWQVADTASTAAVGGGMFNLVRRAAFDRTPGFEWLRLEIADDVVLGQMLKRHGARPIVVNAVGEVSLNFYRTLGEMAWGLEKSGFAVIGRFSYVALLVASLSGVALHGGFLAGFAHPLPWVRALAAVTLAMAVASQVLVTRTMRRSLAPALLFPVGMLSMAVMAMRSGWMVWRRGGVAWRGTLYKVADLRAGRRFEIR
jgi:GNAT superfamily N-acetyltransferase